MDSIESHRQQLIDQILLITKDMLAMAKQTDWDTVIKNENNRQSLLKKFFSIEISNDELSQVTLMIKNIMCIHHEIIQMVNLSKNQMREDVRSINCAQRALKAYAELL